jgi:hypothetical protein
MGDVQKNLAVLTTPYKMAMCPIGIRALKASPRKKVMRQDLYFRWLNHGCYSPLSVSE